MAVAKKLNGTLRDFIERQPMFFVATAARDGRVNLSPKGLDTLRIKNVSRIVWLNLSGSGNETAAHIRDFDRMTLMFCSYESDPMILRVYGHANVLHPFDAGWDEAAGAFPEMAGSRQVFDLAIDLVQTSCGTGVPEMSFVRTRADTELVPYYENMGPEGVRAYWKKKNALSIDGQPTGILSDSADAD